MNIFRTLINDSTAINCDAQLLIGNTSKDKNIIIIFLIFFIINSDPKAPGGSKYERNIPPPEHVRQIYNK